MPANNGAAFKAKAEGRVLAERARVLLPGIAINETEDAEKWPILEFILGDEKVYVKIDATSNGERIDAVTGMAQTFYSPRKLSMIRDSRTTGSMTITISDWETGESITPTVNGVTGSAVPFNTDNDTSVADLATALAGMAGVTSAIAAGNVITLTYSAYNPATVSLAVTGGDGITIAQVAVYTPSVNVRNTLLVQAAQLGLLVLVYAKSAPSSFDITGAYLESRITADPFNQTVSGSYQ